MEAWMAIAIFVGLVVIIVFFIISAIRRGRAYREKAEDLGLVFMEKDTQLNDLIANTLPVFSRGEPDCWYIAKGSNKFGKFYIFQYSYVRTKFNGRRDRDNEGLLYCIHADRDNFDKMITQDRLSACQNDWQIEYGGPFLAIKQKSDKGDKGISGDRLQSFHDEVKQVIQELLP